MRIRVRNPSVLMGAVGWCLLCMAALAGPTIGEPAPPLQGRFFSGQPFDLEALRGKVVLVNFYSSYCQWCALEIGNIEAHYEQLKPKGLEVIMLSIEQSEDRERARRFIDNYSLPGAMAIDLRASGFEKKYPTPTCYVIDKKGVVRDKITGVKRPQYYRSIVMPLLNE